jgi:DNA-binding beta-propeller fold protein YncE
MTIVPGSIRTFCQRLLVVLVGAFALTAGAQMAQTAQAPPQVTSRPHMPIAITALPSGMVATLGSRGGLALINPATGQRTPVKTSLGNFTPLDMTAVHLGDQDFLFVTMFWAFSSQSSQGNEALIVQYSPEGQEVQKWSALGKILAGVAVDANRRIAYLGSSNSGDISQLDLNDQSSPKVVMHIGGASGIGPIALDTEGQRLFAADLGSGSVYTIEIAHHKARQLVSGAGEPAALSYDASQHKLYIADAGRHRISQVSTQTKEGKLTDFYAGSELREPRGVSVAPDHSVWVADFATGAVIHLSQAGKVLATIQP